MSWWVRRSGKRIHVHTAGSRCHCFCERQKTSRRVPYRIACKGVHLGDRTIGSKQLMKDAQAQILGLAIVIQHFQQGNRTSAEKARPCQTKIILGKRNRVGQNCQPFLSFVILRTHLVKPLRKFELDLLQLRISVGVRVPWPDRFALGSLRRRTGASRWSRRRRRPHVVAKWRPAAGLWRNRWRRTLLFNWNFRINSDGRRTTRCTDSARVVLRPRRPTAS